MFIKNRSSKIIHSWCMYDWANSAFAATIMAAVLPSFYSSVAGANLEKTIASSYWGYTNTIAMLIIAFSAPILGAIADHLGRKKVFLSWFVCTGVLATALMVLISKGDWLLASTLYIFGRIGFAGANIFYNSLLPHIVDKDRIDRVSALGYAYGYLGGGLLLTINLLMIMKPALFGIFNAEWGVRLSFITVAVWWALFSFPLLSNVPEPKMLKGQGARVKNQRSLKEIGNPIKTGFSRLRSTLREIKQYRELVKFLLAYWLYNDGIGTIIIMAVIFGAEIGIGQSHLIGAILLVQFVAIPFSLIFGRLAERIGAKNSILSALFTYGLITVLGYFMTEAIHFWVLAFMVATVQGGAQALSRSMYSSMLPKEKSAEFFGFYDVSSKFAGIIGPAVFGIVGQITGSSRYGILALILFFAAGGLLLITVKQEKASSSLLSADY
ncbi:MAG: MFS transporter [Nitrospinota bacterium]|nr:MFS transporter [Nitrospinota bacterium]